MTGHLLQYHTIVIAEGEREETMAVYRSAGNLSANMPHRASPVLSRSNFPVNMASIYLSRKKQYFSAVKSVQV